MPEWIALGGDVHRSKIELGGEGVVGRASQREVCFAVFSALRKRFAVVELEIVRLHAATAHRVDVGAAGSVPVEDVATNPSRDVTGPRTGPRTGFTRGIRIRIGIGVEHRPEHRLRFERQLRFERRLWFERRLRLLLVRPSIARALARLFKRSDEQAQGFELDLVDRCRTSAFREQGARSFDELDELFRGRELDFVAERSESPRRRG